MGFEKALELIGLAFICGKTVGKLLDEEDVKEVEKTTENGKHAVEGYEFNIHKLKGKEAKDFMNFLDKLVGGKNDE